MENKNYKFICETEETISHNNIDIVWKIYYTEIIEKIPGEDIPINIPKREFLCSGTSSNLTWVSIDINSGYVKEKIKSELNFDFNEHIPVNLTKHKTLIDKIKFDHFYQHKETLEKILVISPIKNLSNGYVNILISLYERKYLLLANDLIKNYIECPTQ